MPENNCSCGILFPSDMLMLFVTKKKKKKEKREKKVQSKLFHTQYLEAQVPLPLNEFFTQAISCVTTLFLFEVMAHWLFGVKKILLCVQLLWYGTKLKVNTMTKYSDAFLLAFFGVHINKRHTFSVSSQIIYVMYKPDFPALLQACWPSAKKYLSHLPVLVAALYA